MVIIFSQYHYFLQRNEDDTRIESLIANTNKKLKHNIWKFRHKDLWNEVLSKLKRIEENNWGNHLSCWNNTYTCQSAVEKIAKNLESLACLILIIEVGLVFNCGHELFGLLVKVANHQLVDDLIDLANVRTHWKLSEVVAERLVALEDNIVTDCYFKGLGNLSHNCNFQQQQGGILQNQIVKMRQILEILLQPYGAVLNYLRWLVRFADFYHVWWNTKLELLRVNMVNGNLKSHKELF